MLLRFTVWVLVAAVLMLGAVAVLRLTADLATARSTVAAAAPR